MSKGPKWNYKSQKYQNITMGFHNLYVCSFHGSDLQPSILIDPKHE